MNPYSHIVLATKLESQIKPENPREYYWGTLAADVRYPAGLPRSQTHLIPEQIRAYNIQYPHLKSFLQGYLVHCLADEIELGPIFFKHFPFSLFKNQMYRHHMAVSLELYYFENEKIDSRISGAHNEVLGKLGLNEAVCAKFALAFNQYATSTSMETRFSELFEMLGLDKDSRAEKYRAAAQGFQKNPFLISAVFFGIRNGKISEEIVQTTQALLAKEQL